MIQAKGVLCKSGECVEWKERINLYDNFSRGDILQIISRGDILQINPELDTPKAERFGGMLLIVTEVFSVGVQGYLMHHTDFDAVRFADKAFLRVKFEDIVRVGRMHWMKE